MPNLKQQTPKSSLPSTGVLFGADSTSADSPSTYALSAIFPQINVLSYGAYNDNTNATATTAAIQAAIDYAITVQGVVYFPPGRYAVNSTIYLPDQTDPSTKNKSFGIISDNPSTWGVYGSPIGATIEFSGTELFKAKSSIGTPSVIHSVSVYIKNINFKASAFQSLPFSTANGYAYTGTAIIPTATCFSNIVLTTSVIERCGFYYWRSVIEGALTYKTHIFGNEAAAKQFLKRPVSFPSAVSSDCYIYMNYFTGLGQSVNEDNVTGPGLGVELPSPSTPTVTPENNKLALLEITSANSINVTQNYFDFCYTAIDVGQNDQIQLISDNVFDLCLFPIRYTSGLAQVKITGNEFFRIKNSTSNRDKFKIPALVMVPQITDNNFLWTCIGPKPATDGTTTSMSNLIISNNLYGDANTFIQLAARGNWNITEIGNIGKLTPTDTPVNAVFSTGRLVNSTSSAIYPLDNKNMNLSAWKDQLNSDIRGIRDVYPGLEYYLQTPATFNGTVSSSTLTVTSASGAPIKVGSVVTGPGVKPGTYISALGTGTGGNGTYTLSQTHTIGSAVSMVACSAQPIKVRINQDYSMSSLNGEYLFGKTNLLPTTDFSVNGASGTDKWIPPASGVNFTGNTLNATSATQYSYFEFGTALEAGSYMLCLNATSISGSIEAFWTVSSAPTAYNIATSRYPGTANYEMVFTGRSFFLVKPATAIKRIAILLSGSGVIDYVHLIRIA